MESISGLVERVTFHSQETGFAVLRVKVRGQRDLVTVVGATPSIHAGEWIQSEGVWAQDRDHGLQFKSDSIRVTAPSSREGIEKYLGSGLIKGIGPVYAKKLVAHFGEQVFEIIETASARLEEVPGIGKGRRRKIKSAWDEQKEIRNIMVFLHSHGVSSSRAVRIYKTYGEEALETVRENPYRLAQDIRGIGFKTADQIAEKLGIPADSPLRARAGVIHTLLEQTGNGHCGYPKDSLVQAGSELLQISTDKVATAVDELLEFKELTRLSVESRELIYVPALRAAEEEIEMRILDLAQSPCRFPKVDFTKAVSWLKQKLKIDLAPSQIRALQTALTSRILILTGGPGVGKTTLTRSILAVLEAKQVKITLCAPTGRAAKRMSEATGRPAKTIHRLLEFDPSNGGFKRHEKSPLPTDLLVVDECSMVDTPLMSKLLKALPFDGSLLLVGDVDQLPSVGPGRVLGDLIESGAAPVARLTEIFRQAASSRIITSAHRINQGEFPSLSAKGEDSDFYFIERDTPEAVASTMTQMISERIPKKFGLDPVNDIQTLCPMNTGLLGTRQMNTHLQEKLNSPRPDEPSVDRFGWIFRAGDKVIQTVNNYDKDVFNGDIGRVIKIDPVEQEAHIQFDQREVIYDFGELDEISLAYAITIHKSQGSEFPAIVLPVTTQHYLMLQRNLLYTGVTRGKRLVVLIGQKKALWMAIKNCQATQRFGALLSRLKHFAQFGERANNIA